MMTGGSGRTSRQLSGEWTHNPGCLCSKTSLGCCLLETGTLFPVSFTDWPRSGTWDRTGFFPLPAQDAPTAVNAGSVLLPTPRNWDEAGTPEQWEKRQQEVMEGGHCRSGLPLSIAVALLPTPNVMDSMDPKSPEQIAAQGRSTPGRNGGPPKNLRETAVYELLPTPQSRDFKGAPGAGSRKRGGHQGDLTSALLPTPQRRDFKGSNQPEGRIRPSGRVRKQGDQDLTEALSLLPTPNSTDHKGPSGASRGQPDQKVQMDLPLAISLLPTPGATDWKGSGATQNGRLRSGQPRTEADMDLPEAVSYLGVSTSTRSDGGNGFSEDQLPFR